MKNQKLRKFLVFSLCLICVSSTAQSYKAKGPEPTAVKAPVIIMYASGKAQPPQLSTQELECLADMTFLEAGGESLLGQAAVAHVALNRREHPEFPSNICQVFYQKTNGVCQYDFACLKQKKFAFRQTPEYSDIKFLVNTITAASDRSRLDPTHGSLFFKRYDVKSAWFDTLVEKRKIGNHIFYTDEKSDT